MKLMSVVLLLGSFTAAAEQYGQPVYLIAERAAWEKATAVGTYVTDSLTSEGFIHLSTRSQVLAVANKHYANKSDLVLVKLAPSKFTAELKYEYSGGSSRIYPHLYGALNTDAAVEAYVWSKNSDGKFSFPLEMNFAYECRAKSTADSQDAVVRIEYDSIMAGAPERYNEFAADKAQAKITLQSGDSKAFGDFFEIAGYVNGQGTRKAVQMFLYQGQVLKEQLSDKDGLIWQSEAKNVPFETIDSNGKVIDTKVVESFVLNTSTVVDAGHELFVVSLRNAKGNLSLELRYPSELCRSL